MFGIFCFSKTFIDMKWNEKKDHFTDTFLMDLFNSLYNFTTWNVWLGVCYSFWVERSYDYIYDTYNCLMYFKYKWSWCTNFSNTKVLNDPFFILYKMYTPFTNMFSRFRDKVYCFCYLWNKFEINAVKLNKWKKGPTINQG